jgi:hypothetical protein
MPKRLWSPFHHRYALLFIGVFVAQLIFFLVVARYRLVDGDEGFYLMASRLVFEHRAPYLDFFFSQTPLLPYAYGTWVELVGQSWVAGRAFSCVLAALLGTLLFAYVCGRTRRPSAGLAAAVLFASSTLVFAWFTIVKTFALSGLLLFTAFLFLRSWPARFRSAAIFSGVALGLAADVRLYLAGLIPLFLWWIFRDPAKGARLRGMMYFTAGFAAAVLPNLYFIALDPKVFLFDNLLFHAIRSDAGLVGNYAQKVLVLGQLCLRNDGGNGVQTCMLLAAMTLSIGRLRAVNTATRRLLELAAAVAGISLLPTPSYVQYFSLCVPFLAAAAVCGASDVLEELDLVETKRRVFAIAGAGFMVLFVAAAVTDYGRFCVTGAGVNGIHGAALAPNWTIDRVREVSRAVDGVTAPGEPVLSLWPGYLFESHARPFPGSENNTGRDRADALSLSELVRYRIVSLEQIEHGLSRHEPRVVVVGNQESMFVEAKAYLAMLSRYGYTVARRVGGSTVWTVAGGR